MGKQNSSTEACHIQRVSIARSFFEGYARNNHGITLIALVITIIILLILAGITINLTIRRTWYNKNG